MAEWKQRGNEAFARKAYDEAIAAYTEALAAQDPPEPQTAAALYSNRSACHAARKDFSLSLADARHAVEQRPSWPKAHGRVGAALHGLGACRREPNRVGRPTMTPDHDT